MKSLQTSETLLNNLKQKLEKARPILVQSTDMQIKYDLSNQIIDKLLHIIVELKENKNDLHKHTATLRYVLETLIISELIVKEDDYFLKVYYSIYTQQENKIREMIKRLNNEIEILKEYYKLYQRDIEEAKRKYSHDIKTRMEEDERIFQTYKKLLNENINIFYVQLEEFGFDILIDVVEKEILPQYTAKLNEFEQLKNNRAKILVKEDWFKKYFDVRGQASKVFKCFSDNRGWKDKAKEVGLEKEYELNYEKTSALLHFTAYSIITSNDIDQEEIDYNHRLINQYIKKISDNLSAFTKAMIFDIVGEVIHV